MLRTYSKLIIAFLLFSSSIIFADGVKLDPPEIFHVKDEKLKLSTTPSHKWGGGTTLKQLYSNRPKKSTPVGNSLKPGSVTVSLNGKILEKGRDYAIDEKWAKLWIPKDSKLTPSDTVSVDYSYALLRIDSEILTADGKRIIRKGISHLTIPLMPKLQPDEKRLCNYLIWYNGSVEKYPINPSQPDPRQTTGPEHLPKLMKKLKNGEKVKIVAWGDSVTNGGDAKSPEKRYVRVFEKMMQETFPAAEIELKKIAVGGSTSNNWLYPQKYPHSSQPQKCNIQRILDEKPDLITIEFVNDAYMNSATVEKQYTEILRRLKPTGAEIILIAPHFTKPDMMKFKDESRKESRPYVKALKNFAKTHNIALADVSGRWEQLKSQGIPYMTLLHNGINHPDNRGHQLFAEELMRCVTQHKKTATQPSKALQKTKYRGFMIDIHKFNETVAEELEKKWNANIIRCQMRPQIIAGQKRISYAEAWQEILKMIPNVLDTAKKHGIMVVLDMHGIPNDNMKKYPKDRKERSAAFWNDNTNLCLLIKCWRQIADICKNRPEEIWFDIKNEPLDWNDFPEYPKRWPLWAQQTITAIRKIDKRHPIVIEPGPGGLCWGFKNFPMLRGENLIYSLHQYQPHAYTMQGIKNLRGTDLAKTYDDKKYRWPGTYSDSGGGYWDKERIRKEIQPVIEFQKKHKVRIYVGEFSVARWVPDAAEYLRDCISLFEEYGWDWTYHAFRESTIWSLEHENTYTTHPKLSKTQTDRAAVIHEFMNKNQK